jgi:signal transduction histidine kinase
MLARMERSIDRCNRIINDLLEYSRTSPLRLRPQAIDDWVCEAVAAQNLPEEVAVVFDLEAAGAVVELDAARLRRALGNVVENAVHAVVEAGAGGVRIVVRTRRDGARVAIEIEDNGPGIKPEIAVHAFDPLFSTRAFGTGLGLPTARQIVEQHGGSIELENLPGGGACAVVRLPATDAPITVAR